MTRLAQALACRYTLRSGAAIGADTAFEAGAVLGGGDVEIYLPDVGYNDHPAKLVPVSAQAMAMARSVHPVFDELELWTQKLHARNCYQVLGANLNVPSEFTVCWTKDGCESMRTRNRSSGGTATAIVLSEAHGVPVFNLRNDSSSRRLQAYLSQRGIPGLEFLTSGMQESLF
jgi:hypothetical protein